MNQLHNQEFELEEEFEEEVELEIEEIEEQELNIFGTDIET